MKLFLIFFLTLIASTGFLYSDAYSIKSTTNKTYTPDILTVGIGDSVTIAASIYHPCVQVDKATWEAKMATPLSGGWGTKTSPYTFVASKADTIYFVCSAHIAYGMRGKIIVQGVESVNEITNELINISITPNPITSVGTIELNGASGINPIIQIYDVYGNSVKDIIVNNEFHSSDRKILFDVQDLVGGTYLLVITNEQGQVVKKIIVLK